MPSSHQWFAVALTANIVANGCPRISHRHRLTPACTTTAPTHTAHATWTDGIAEIWSEIPWPIGP